MKIKYILIFTLCVLLNSCGDENQSFPLDKRYWDTDDYYQAISELRFGYEDDEKKPTFDDPEQRKIVQKLTDEQNFKVVLNDEELGLQHRNNVSTKFFQLWQDMTRIYQDRDRKDNYLYDLEMIAVYHFGLGLQLEYFRLGNEVIKDTADDPESTRIQNIVNDNIATLIKNYIIYLDEINEEKSFSEEGKSKLASGIDKYFTKLIESHPEANYSSMRKKAELMFNKSENKEIQNSLKKLMVLIDSHKKTN